jgi:hypothetical protein
LEDEAKGSTHASNWMSSLCPQSIAETHGQARIESPYWPPGWLRLYQHLQDLAAYQGPGHTPRDVVFEPTKFYEGLQGYAQESVIEEVIELLAFPEEFESDDMAIEDLLTTRQRRQRQPAHTSALMESQMGGEVTE